ncbi:hypothetical protein NUU61_010034 [Penicillium alfredii]|uniref:NAD(P)-binding protein n=1 Tax=Penicillium alfredii TaxID=1506179 RepID=A0A9W9EHE0_9EURO|nr:uncharacterized protein NUU61_010034 [Penicillium alfredii]KAJ5081770.1 hypothetical protein NUU61_010034 [Penicillium alfredii]
MAEKITSTPAKSSLSTFWWASRHPTPDPTTSFVGKTVLITGANAGLGFEAATKFAALGTSKLIFGVRSLKRGEEAKARIEQKTGCAADVIQIVQLDMSNYASIEGFAKEVTTEFSDIHAAVLNAGVAAPAHNLSPEGWEMSLQVNVISTVYLSLLLLPILRRTGETTGQATHLEFVTSVGHGDVNIKSVQDPHRILDKINDPKNFNFMTQYTITKLLEVWAVRAIAAKVPASRVIITASCPSLCKSTLGRNFNTVLRILDALMKAVFAKTAEQGSRVLVSAVTTGPEAHGGFWSHDRVAE